MCVYKYTCIKDIFENGIVSVSNHNIENLWIIHEPPKIPLQLTSEQCKLTYCGIHQNQRRHRGLWIQGESMTQYLPSNGTHTAFMKDRPTEYFYTTREIINWEIRFSMLVPNQTGSQGSWTVLYMETCWTSHQLFWRWTSLINPTSSHSSKEPGHQPLQACGLSTMRVQSLFNTKQLRYDKKHKHIIQMLYWSKRWMLLLAQPSL